MGRCIYDALLLGHFYERVRPRWLDAFPADGFAVLGVGAVYALPLSFFAEAIVC